MSCLGFPELFTLAAPPVICGRDDAIAKWSFRRALLVDVRARMAGDLIVEAEALYEAEEQAASADAFEVAGDACAEVGATNLAEECRHTAWFLEPERIPDHCRRPEYRRDALPIRSTDKEGR